MAGGGGKAHDPADAAGYLHQYLRLTGKQTIRLADLESWLNMYQVQGQRDRQPGGVREAVRLINEASAQMYGRQSII